MRNIMSIDLYNECEIIILEEPCSHFDIYARGDLDLTSRSFSHSLKSKNVGVHI